MEITISREQTDGAMTYWTVENNAIGEAAPL